MNLWLGLSILLGAPATFLAAGAWIGQRLDLESAARRIAVSLLAGLAATLLALSVVNLVLPLRGAALALIFAPVLLSVLTPDCLVRTGRDLREIARRRSARLALGASVIALTALLWPLLAQPQARFYDGSANHDAFFWIVGAEHLRASDYLHGPAPDAASALGRVSTYHTGFLPEWGRMGAEGYLAAVAGLTGQSPLTIYLWAAAALYWAWLAAVFLVTDRFVVTTWRWPPALALGALQPLFASYHHNANLPNLLGMLCGATLVWATDGALRDAAAGRPRRFAWGGLGALSLHGMLVSYPEIAPFILVPCGLLTWRAVRESVNRGQVVRLAAATFVAGFALNPVTTLRAAHGFAVAFASARANTARPDFLAKLEPAESVPALLTLSGKTGQELGLVGGALISLALAAAVWLACRQSRDRIGLACASSGLLLLSAYTAATGFHYGWQKLIQFSGVFVSAVLPLGALAALTAPTRRRGATTLAAIGLGAFFVYALTIIQLDLLKWSQRKGLGQAELQLAALDGRAAGSTPVVVDSGSFAYGFFYGMWAEPLWPGQPIVHVSRDRAPGGYLQQPRETEPAALHAAPVLVAREWADAVEPDATRLGAAGQYVLLRRAHRILALSGMRPASGVPRTVEPEFSLTVTSPQESRLEVEIEAPADASLRGAWIAHVDPASGAAIAATSSADGKTWRIVCPLAGGTTTTLHCRYRPDGAAGPADFALRGFRFVTSSR